MIRFDVTVDSELLDQLAALGLGKSAGKVFPIGSAAFSESAQFIRGTWKEWLNGGDLDGIPKNKYPSPNLGNSIRIRENAPFDVNIESDSARVQRIQEGTEELDMKNTHPFGKKSRVSEDGIPYVIVPIRWGTPNSKGGKRAHWGNFISKPLFESQFAKMKTSKKTGYVKKSGEIVGHVHTEPNYRGEDVIRQEYQWGGRHEGDGNMDGMVRMAGGGGYFTFRVISALQFVTAPNAWIRKRVEPVDMLGALERTPLSTS